MARHTSTASRFLVRHPLQAKRVLRLRARTNSAGFPCKVPLSVLQPQQRRRGSIGSVEVSPVDAMVSAAFFSKDDSKKPLHEL